MINRQHIVRNAKLVVVGILFQSSCIFAADTTSYEIDKMSGLVKAPGWETVLGNCTACHSARFITAQRGDRETWKSMIRWMQKTQGLWQFPDEVEVTILDYLSTNYPPGKSSRRANLPSRLMPQGKASG